MKQKLNYTDLYFQAIDIALAEFVDEEKNGYLFTEKRLLKKIKAARVLYKDKMNKERLDCRIM